MFPELLNLIAAVLISSAISVGMLWLGFRTYRADGSRRWIFVAGGAVGCLMTIPAGFVCATEVGADQSVAIVIVCAIVLIASLVLLQLGIRGRRVGDHPHCRRCRFDLFGKPETSTQCPECGSNLNDEHATVIGVRQRRTSLIFGALFLMLVSLGVGVPGWWNAYGKGIDWNKHKPDWWLVMQWNPGNLPGSSGVDEELRLRLERGELSRSSRDRFAQRLIDSGKAGNAILPWAYGILDYTDERPIDETLLRELIQATCTFEWNSEPIVEYGREIPFIHNINGGRVEVLSVDDSVNGIKIPPQQIKNLPANEFGFTQGTSIICYVLDLGSIWKQLLNEPGQPFDFILERQIRLSQSLTNGSTYVTVEWTVTLNKKLTAMPKGISKSQYGTSQVKAIVRRVRNLGWLEFERNGKALPISGSTTVFNIKWYEPHAKFLTIPISSLRSDGNVTATQLFSVSNLDSSEPLHLELRRTRGDWSQFAPELVHEKHVIDTIIDEGIAR